MVDFDRTVLVVSVTTFQNRRPWNMYKLFFKIAGGVLLGVMLCAYAYSEAAISFPTICLFLLWGVGIVYGFRIFLRWLGTAMQSAMQLSIISALSFGTGIIGLIVLIFVAVAILAFGWIYGIYLLIRDIIAII